MNTTAGVIEQSAQMQTPSGALTADEQRAAPPHVAQPTPSDEDVALRIRLLAIAGAARFHGVELDASDIGCAAGVIPSPAMLAAWVARGGLISKAARLQWKQLVHLDLSSPAVLLTADGGAALLVAADQKRSLVWIRHSRMKPSEPPIPVDEFAMSQVWNGDVLLLKARHKPCDADAPFSLGWVAELVWMERHAMRDVGLASLVLSLLTVLPPMMVMTVIDQVVTHQNQSTLVLLSLMIGVAMISEMLLGYARRQLIIVVGARVDAKLNLHVFQRLLRLPLDFFERNQSGSVWSMTGLQINKIREFLTGKLLSTMLDLVTLIVLLPVLFFLQPVLSAIVLVCAGLISAVMVAFMRPMSARVKRWIDAETEKSSAMVETLHGIRTVKSLALESQQHAKWDAKVADAASAKIAAGKLGNLLQTAINPIEGFMQRGVLLLGAYLALADNGGMAVGGLVAFMMLSARVAQPLASLAKLMEDIGEVRTATMIAGQVLNQRPEVADQSLGMRPRLRGTITFGKVVYSYPGACAPALDQVSFTVPAGSTLGVVGRSGSGKSTIARLLQGITRDYKGQAAIDGIDIKDINLTHLRRNFGVVPQDNFLFRGTVRENILAGRPGLTSTDAVRAAELAGAAEFIERLPQGYDTMIEEGSTNLSGGQRQRLAIARALIHDPRILILDEATSALDPESEALVNANLKRIACGRTTVIVSHRLSSLTTCDQILVLDQGRVLDIAPHHVLLARCATYQQLWHQQNGHITSGADRIEQRAPYRLPRVKLPTLDLART